MPLFLLPNVFQDDQPIDQLLPQGVSKIIASLDHLIAENERSGRRYLLKLVPNNEKMRSMPITLLNEHTTAQQMHELEHLIRKGGNWGLVSDAGLPCIADPGSALVLRLRKHPEIVTIKTFSGPSSICMALTLSGLSGQKFCFHGYLPKQDEKREAFLKKIEARSRENEETQIWIETPYRNKFLIESCRSTLHPTTIFSIASNISFENEKVKTQSIEEWNRLPRDEIEQFTFPSVFLLMAAVVPKTEQKRAKEPITTKNTKKSFSFSEKNRHKEQGSHRFQEEKNMFFKKKQRNGF